MMIVIDGVAIIGVLMMGLAALMMGVLYWVRFVVSSEEKKKKGKVSQ